MKTKLLKDYLRLRKRPWFERGVTSSVWQDFSHICFVSRHNQLTRNTCFTIVKQSLFYQRCVYNVQTMLVCVSWMKQFTPTTLYPMHFSETIFWQNSLFHSSKEVFLQTFRQFLENWIFDGKSTAAYLTKMVKI